LLYEAVAAWGGGPRILFVSSGAIYGEPADPSKAIDEQTELRPNNPYAASKAAADLLSYQTHRTLRLEIIRVRPFNHVGPGQSPAYAVANFARQLAAIERHESPPVLRVGNLAAERDLTDVRDVVRAYELLLERGTPGEAYNLASGRLRPMREYLQLLLSLSRAPVRVETDPNLIRKVDTSTAPVDATKLRTATGWVPQVTLEQTLRDTLEYWRGVVKGS
jgi:GDP-4-dehydro-6-deoxy-D-mannose reductase